MANKKRIMRGIGSLEKVKKEHEIKMSRERARDKENPDYVIVGEVRGKEAAVLFCHIITLKFRFLSFKVRLTKSENPRGVREVLSCCEMCLRSYCGLYERKVAILSQKVLKNR